jgi:glycosyltransferase involved in cell wall biosynthesis
MDDEDLLPLLDATDATRSVTLLVPAGPSRRSDGYVFDREIAAGLRALGWRLQVVMLEVTYPSPTAEECESAARALAALPGDSLVVADGSVFAAIGDAMEREAFRLKFVGLVHDLVAAETPTAGAKLSDATESERRVLGAMRGVVATSHGTSRAVASYAIPRDRIAVVMPGTTPASPARGTRGVDGRDDDTPVELLCVGPLVPRKGHEALFDALADLRHLSWHLTCVGSDTADPVTVGALREQLDLSGLNDVVTLAGDLDDHALSDAYDRADVFVLATRHEGYGIPVADAVARGLPVVSTLAGAIPELVDWGSGAVVPIDDPAALTAALEPLIADDAERARRAAGARSRAETLPHWPDSVRAVADALERFAALELLPRSDGRPDAAHGSENAFAVTS